MKTSFILVKAIIIQRFIKSFAISISELKHEVFDTAAPCS